MKKVAVVTDSNAGIRQKEVNELLKEHGTSELNTGTKMAELLKRTELNYDILEKIYLVFVFLLDLFPLFLHMIYLLAIF